jgi:hypothetical protein
MHSGKTVGNSGMPVRTLHHGLPVGCGCFQFCFCVLENFLRLLSGIQNIDFNHSFLLDEAWF